MTINEYEELSVGDVVACVESGSVEKRRVVQLVAKGIWIDNFGKPFSDTFYNLKSCLESLEITGEKAS